MTHNETTSNHRTASEMVTGRSLQIAFHGGEEVAAAPCRRRTASRRQAKYRAMLSSPNDRTAGRAGVPHQSRRCQRVGGVTAGRTDRSRCWSLPSRITFKYVCGTSRHVVIADAVAK